MGAPPTTACRRLPSSAVAKSGCSASIRYWVGTPISVVTRRSGDQLQHPAGFEAAFQHHGGAGPPGQQRLDVPAADVELRQHGQHDVGAAQIHRPGQRKVGPEAVGMGQHGGLAGPLGAGREDHQEGVVVAHFPLRPDVRTGFRVSASGTAGALTLRCRRGPARRSGAGARGARRRLRRGDRARPPRAAAGGSASSSCAASSRGESRQDSGTRTSPALAQAKNTTTWSELLPVRVAIRSPVT